MSTLWQNIQYKIQQSGSKITLLIGINVAVFLLASIPPFVGFANEYLVLSPSLPIVGRHFWTPVSYMFMHAGFFPILFNMLWLYWMGRIFEEYLNHKRLVGLYFLGGLTGAVFYVAAYNILKLSGVNFALISITGATVSVVAIVVATATLLPDYELSLIIIGRVKLKWVCIIYVIIAILGATGNIGTQIAHVGGAVIGFVYIKQLQRGNDWIEKVYKLFNPKPKMKVVANPTTQKRSTDLPRQEEIDRILDKISGSGYDSLSKQEKEILFRASNHNEG